ncbi:zinc finger protein [Stylonychia lemnae]|uniref:Zinc finger protein n=1 Tax=Stylonychia lemnae TaxID=5949 RepID=A0A077ZN15_STYLE|nr:zinc finger protein [Stylonychia lemnae]|eukprot:CDW71362.1 zinc finger protein [Stylonychia lemnae]
MESKNNNNGSVLCGNCKTFFGNHDTNFMCSKCFKESQKQEQQNQSAEKKVQEAAAFALNQSQPTNLIEPILIAQQKVEITAFQEEVKQAANEDQVMQDLSQSNQPAVETKQVQTNKNLCWSCKRKVGLLGFACKCDYVFCGKHRYAEEHACEFDYKQRQQEKLAKENPLVKNGKIQKI